MQKAPAPQGFVNERKWIGFALFPASGSGETFLYEVLTELKKSLLPGVEAVSASNLVQRRKRRQGRPERAALREWQEKLWRRQQHPGRLPLILTDCCLDPLGQPLTCCAFAGPRVSMTLRALVEAALLCV